MFGVLISGVCSVANEIVLVGADNGSYALLYRRGDDYSVQNRLNTFAQWCAEQGLPWFQADLAEYRDFLLEDLMPSSVQSHLSTLRQRIKDVTTDNRLYKSLHQHFVDQGYSPADSEAQIQHFLRTLENMANARHSSVKVTKIQDYADSQRIWLTTQQIDTLLLGLHRQAKTPEQSQRDQSLVALFLTTGIRVAELCALQVSDLYETFKGHPALRVRQGKGSKQRMVVYGDLIWGRDEYVRSWIDTAKLTEKDILFQSFWRGATKLRGRPLDKFSVRRILRSVELDCGWISPHDLRRTYARMLFRDFKMGLEEIRDQLGHTSVSITESYVGLSDIEERIPRWNKSIPE